MLYLHIFAGFCALLAGALAMSARKGAGLHRKSGWVFVGTMLLMSFTGAIIAMLLPVRVSVIAGALTFYLVVTAFVTLRRPPVAAFAIDVGAMLFAIGTALTAVYFGFEAMGSPKGRLDGYPPQPFFVFASAALVGAALDARILLVGAPTGKHRIARHLWRMSFAMLLATTSFFIGQAKLFPEPLRNLALLSIPAIAVIVCATYWLARLLFVRRP